jgi:hypothetical protein
MGTATMGETERKGAMVKRKLKLQVSRVTSAKRKSSELKD